MYKLSLSILEESKNFILLIVAFGLRNTVTVTDFLREVFYLETKYNGASITEDWFDLPL